jgi:uncharacterized membrane protein
VRRSSDAGTMFKRTWGENVAAQVGFGLLGMIAVIPAIIVVALLGAAGGVAAVIGIVLAVVWVLVVVMTLSALSGIYQTVLYRYAAGLDLTDTPFDAATLDAAFAPKRGTGGTMPKGIAG